MGLVKPTFDERAAYVKDEVINKTSEKTTPLSSLQKAESASLLKENIMHDMEAAVKQLDIMRTPDKDRRAIEINMAEFVKEKWGFSPANNGAPESFMDAIGVNPSEHSIGKLMSMPDFNDGYRWLVPEVVREAVRLGLRKAPIFPNLIASEETVSQPSVIMPHINLSDATPKKLNEAETISTGSTTFGQKTVKLQKVGTGIKITDEVQNYVSINMLSLYLQDVGVKLGQAEDSLAIDVLINGDQADGSEAAAVIGVTTPTTLAYIDILRAWIRMGRLGRMPSGILSNEDMAMEVLQLPEFKALAGKATLQNIVLSTPIPASQNYWIHGGMPTSNKIMLIDTTSALIKLNAQPLRVETERIAQRQLSGTYVTLTTGFANLFRDSRVIIDKSLNISAAPFPTWMDPNAAQAVTF